MKLCLSSGRAEQAREMFALERPISQFLMAKLFAFTWVDAGEFNERIQDCAIQSLHDISWPFPNAHWVDRLTVGQLFLF